MKTIFFLNLVLFPNYYFGPILIEQRKPAALLKKPAIFQKKISKILDIYFTNMHTQKLILK
jgi:hypothetical protein